MPGCGVYYATDNSQLSFAGQRDRSNVCKRGEHFYSAREIRGFSRSDERNVNRIGIDPPRQIAATSTRCGEWNRMIGVEPTARQSIQVTQIRQARTVVSTLNRRFSDDERSADRVDFKVYAVYRH